MPALSRRWLIAPWTLVLLIHYAYGREFYFLCDDAYITFRYARNLALGRGLVWNVGEYVEGYTNFLWTLLMAASIKIGLSPETMAPLLGVLFTLATLAFLPLYARRLLPGSAALTAMLAAGILAINRSWNVWATGGLETRCFTFLCLSGIYFLLLHGREVKGQEVREPSGAMDGYGREVKGQEVREPSGATPSSGSGRLLGSFLLGLATLTRPDGMLIYGMCVIAWMIESRAWLAGLVADFGARWREQSRRLLEVGLPYVLVAGAHFLFRLYYYGDPLPNTYYAKIDEPWPAMGFLYLYAFALEYGLTVWVPAGLVILLLAGERAGGMRRFYLYFLLICAAHAIYYAYSAGGDHFEYRVLDFYLPFIALFMAHGLVMLFSEARRRWPRGAWSRLGAGLVGAWLLVLYVFIPNWRFFLPVGIPLRVSGVPWQHPSKIIGNYSLVPVLAPAFVNWKEVQLRLQRHLIAIRMESHREFHGWRSRQLRPFFGKTMPPGAVTAEGGIGLLGYFVDIPVIDTLGLTDRLIARERIPLHDDPDDRQIAHNRRPPPGYLAERGVNLIVKCVVSGLATDFETIQRECPEWRYFLGHPGHHYIARWRDFHFVYTAPGGRELATEEWTRRTFEDWRHVNRPEDRR